MKQFALKIHFLGPKVYRFIKTSLNLPSIRTLQRVTERWEIFPGFSDLVFKVLTLKGSTMSAKSRECVLCVDEMSIKAFLYYNTVKDKGFHNTGSITTHEVAKSVMIIMICGLHATWKQSLCYFFVVTNCSGYDLQSIIFNFIQKLSSISFNVKVMISDLGSNFKKFADQQGITPETPYFNVSGKEIVFMFDPPHLLKATRNNFFNYKFDSNNKVADKVNLEKFNAADKTHNVC